MLKVLLFFSSPRGSVKLPTLAEVVQLIFAHMPLLDKEKAMVLLARHTVMTQLFTKNGEADFVLSESILELMNKI